MMKSLAAVAAIATMTMAGRSRGPRLIPSYDYGDDELAATDSKDFLGLKKCIPATIKYPKDRRSRGGQCAGWTLNEPDKVYTSFDLVVSDGRCKKIEFTVKEGLTDYPLEVVELSNDCGGGATWTIEVQAFDDGVACEEEEEEEEDGV